MSLVSLKNYMISLLHKNDSDMESNSLNNNINNSDTENYGTINSQNNNSGNNFLSDSYSSSLTNLNNNNNNNGTKYSQWWQELDPRIISDLIIGLSDGLTVPFALTAGLSSLGDSHVVITGGFAELISGAISMGLGGYLGAKSEIDYYKSEVSKEKKKFYQDSILVNHDVEDILLEINPNFSEETILSFIKDLQNAPDLMLEFIIKYGRDLDEPAENRQLISAMTIGGGYLFGGLIPLLPYFFVKEVGTGLFYSVIVMIITLFWFGYFKAIMSMGSSCTIHKKIYEGFEMVIVGGVAASAAWFFVRLLG